MNGSGDVDANLEFTSMSNDPQFMVSIYLKGLFYNVSIGDPAHGYLVHKKTSSFRVAVGWLQDQARRLYPHSRYVQELLATDQLLASKF